jgi:hypothetical protein
MKPLLIFKFTSEEYDPEKAEKFDEYIQDIMKDGNLTDYEIIVLWGGDAKVYYPFNFITFYYQKLKTWLILKIRKNK